MISRSTLFERYGIYIFLALLLIVASMVSPAFLRPQNLKDILMQVAPLAIVAIGQTFVILSGNEGIDLSVASVMATAATICSVTTGGQDSMFLAAAMLCLGLGVAIGLANGLLITKQKCPAVLTTLAMMIMIDGLRLLGTGGAPKGDFPPFMRLLGTGTVGSLPVSILGLGLLTAIAGIVLKKTVFGRQIYATGGNIRTAKLCGYNTDLMITAVYMISGFMAAMAGIFLGGWIGVVDNWVGKGYEIDSIAVVVMGGTSFEGGRGGVFGTVAGVIIIMVLYNLVLLVHLPIFAQYIVKGGVIVLAAYFYVRRVAR